MTAPLVGLGALLVAVSLLDLVWTTIAAGSGAGPITGRLARGLWSVALGIHGRTGGHRFLAAAGVAIVVTLLAVWIALVYTGWLLVFTSSDGAVRSAQTGLSADLVERAYFTGYSVFTLGVGDLVPGHGLWQVATVLATASGLILVTLAITYLVPVASAVAERRRLASYVASLGSNAHEIVIRGWNGQGFSMLSQHMVSLTPLLHAIRQQHLTYPVLHYFHSDEVESAAPPNLVSLSGAVHLMRCGVAPYARPDPGALESLDAAIGSFLETLGPAGTTAAPEPLEPASLQPLGDAGIPVVGDAVYEASIPGTEERRRRLAGLLRSDGWPRDAIDPATARG